MKRDPRPDPFVTLRARVAVYAAIGAAAKWDHPRAPAVIRALEQLAIRGALAAGHSEADEPQPVSVPDEFGGTDA